MSEQGKDLDTQNEQVQEKEVHTDPYVEKALELGWRPEEEWDGSPEDFIDAKEFVRRQPLFDKISGLSKHVKNLEQSFEALKQHHTRVKEVEFQRAVDTLQKARRQAMRDGETEQALAIEEKIEDIQSQKQEFEELQKEQPSPQAPNPAFVSWMEQNKWYQKDDAMTAYADTLGVKLKQQGLDNDEILKRVTVEVRKEFKHKFTNPKRDSASSVEGGSRKPAAGNKLSDVENSMSEQDRSMMNKLIRSGALTKEQYLEEFQRIQGN